jgi:hypothetical protein
MAQVDKKPLSLPGYLLRISILIVLAFSITYGMLFLLF